MGTFSAAVGGGDFLNFIARVAKNTTAFYSNERWGYQVAVLSITELQLSACSMLAASKRDGPRHAPNFPAGSQKPAIMKDSRVKTIAANRVQFHKSGGPPEEEYLGGQIFFRCLSDFKSFLSQNKAALIAYSKEVFADAKAEATQKQEKALARTIAYASDKRPPLATQNLRKLRSRMWREIGSLKFTESQKKSIDAVFVRFQLFSETNFDPSYNLKQSKFKDLVLGVLSKGNVISPENHGLLQLFAARKFMFTAKVRRASGESVLSVMRYTTQDRVQRVLDEKERASSSGLHGDNDSEQKHASSSSSYDDSDKIIDELLGETKFFNSYAPL